MHPAQIWKFYQDAKTSGVSMSKLAEVRRREEHWGCSPGVVQCWQRKILFLYEQRSQMAFVGSRHLTLVTDGSTHGCRETLVTAVYDPLHEIAAWCCCQDIYPSKVVGPMDYDLLEEVERLLARREGERLSSYKVMQALSKQLSLLSRKSLTLSSFALPEAQQRAVTPLEPGDLRHVENGVLTVRKANGQEETVDILETIRTCKTLCVLSDQGPSMTASMSFLAQSQHFLVHAVFDGFHRLVNDTKLAANAAGLSDARLAAQSLWSVNYGPFGSGAFFDEKVAALEYFYQVTTVVPQQDVLRSLLGQWK